MLNVSDGEDEAAGSTLTEAERLRRQRRSAILDLLIRTIVDDTDDDDEWERVFRVREELLDAGVLDVENADRDETEYVLELSVQALENQRRTADDRRVPQECSVCLDVVKLDRRDCCGLTVCEDCMKRYVETQLQEAGVVRIACPNPACGKFMFQEEIRELLRARPELRQRYDRWLVDVNADPRRKTCPRCCRITEVQTAQSVDRRTAKYGVMVDCECQFRWCFSCQAPWHEGLTCAKNKAGDELLKRWAHQKIRNVNNAQRCPKCKVRFLPHLYAKTR